MANFQDIQCQNTLKTLSNLRNFALRVNETNGGVRIFTAYVHQNSILCSVYPPSCAWFVESVVQVAGITRKRVTQHVRVALSADVVVRTPVFVIVARVILGYVCTTDVIARVSGKRCGLIQMTLVTKDVPDEIPYTQHRLG